MPQWRNARALDAFVAAVDRRWPLRDRRSDGDIGDAKHATQDSDHNPWLIVAGVGVVRANDVDEDGIDAPWLVEQLRKLGAAGDRRLAGGGYLIYEGFIAGDWTGWAWVPYTGANRHDRHLHISYSRDPVGFDSTAPWLFLEEDDPMALNDLLPNANPDSRARKPQQTVSDCLQDVQANAHASARIAVHLQSTITAQQATIDGLSRLIAHWSGLQLADIERTVRAAIADGLAEGIDVELSVSAGT